MKNKCKQIVKANEVYLEWLLVGFLTLISVSLVFNHNAWVDEIYSMRWTKLSWPDMMHSLINDVHPPLYYFLLKIWNTLTNFSLVGAKLFSVLPVAAYLSLGIIFVKKQFGRKAMVFYLLFITFVPCMLEKTVEVRMYTWTVLFSILSGIYLYYLMKEQLRKNWILFTVFSLAAAYTHYYGLAAMIFIYLALLVYFVFLKNWKQILYFFICCAATIAGYLPWLGIALKQITAVNQDYWIQPASSRLSYIRELLISNFPYSEKIFLMLIVVLILYTGILFLIKKNWQLYWALAVCAPIWCTMFAGHLYGTLVRPVLISRYIIISLCLMVLGLSAVWKYINKYLLIPPCLFFLAVGCFTYREVYAAEYHTLTDSTMTYMQKTITSGEMIAYDVTSLDNAILYYIPQAIPKSNFDIYHEDYESVWYFGVNEKPDQKRLEQNGIECESIGSFGFDNLYFEAFHLSRQQH